MSTYTRRSAWKNGGTLAGNTDLLWYAKGVGAMQARALNDHGSWWFFAAIHGQYVSGGSFPGWGHIPGPPSVPTSPLPSSGDRKLYWDQCQHQSWYFPPWHRGYLVALEAQLRAAIIKLGGPADWALPYWNYFGPNSDYKIPPAFTDPTLPDGTANPLYVTARYGPNNDGDIFISIPPADHECMTNSLYTGSNAATPGPGFGGPQTGFHNAGGLNGNLENNPHNHVHVDVGGNSPKGGKYWGLMSDPGLAALDPVFYLHHANIDRLWAVWNKQGNGNPADLAWKNGPGALGGRKFAMPMPGGSSWVYTPAQVDSLDKMDYTYDDLAPVTPPLPPGDLLLARLHRLGVGPVPPPNLPPFTMDTGKKFELVGANDGALPVTSAGARATVRLNPIVRRSLSANLLAASPTALPDRAYLQLENVRGTRDAHKLTVSVNGHLAGTVALFGLRRASAPGGEHGASGLTFQLNITNIVDTLHVEHGLEADTLDVRITPTQAVPANADISIGRVSVYRESHQ